MKRAIYYVISVLLLCVVPITSAQGDCPALVEQALAAVGQMCQSTGRNQACYGNIKIDTEPQPGADDFRFEVVGDTVNVADIQQMILSGMNEASSEWGVALLRLQTSIPGTLPGQNVTFLLFGDVALAPDESVTDAPPLSAFLLRTGINDAPCEEAPESGLLVQTPDGVSEVTFSINGVEVQMGSTVLFKNDSEGAMSVSTLEGLALAGAGTEAQFIVPGTWASVPVGNNGRAAGDIERPRSYQGRVQALQSLPVRALQRQITVAPPLTEEQLELMRAKLDAGELPCGEGPLPDCERLKTFVQNRLAMCEALRPRQRPPFCRRIRTFAERVREINQNSTDQGILPTPLPQMPPPIESAPPLDTRECVFPPGPNDPPLPESETRPFCPETEPLPPDTRECVFPPGPNDPPLPESETRPFCPESEQPPPPPGG